MGWPLSQDYNEAIQSPAESFADLELRQGEAATNALGIPQPRSGNFADVYEVRCPGGERWAVKCFTREVPGLRDRYLEISRWLQQAHLPFTVEFTYQEQGIRIRGGWYPILKMQWVEGLTLNEFVRQHLEKPAMLEALLQIWGRMGAGLRKAGIAHADLQHSNVLLVPGSTAASVKVKLIDYDGMYVPTLAGRKSGEVGHPSYQHPQRLRKGAFGPEVDRFPLLLIATSLRCLEAGGPELWQRHDNGDNLLFRETDLKAPRQSALFRELRQLDDPGAWTLVNLLAKSLEANLEAAPLLDEVLPTLKPIGVAAPVTLPPTVRIGNLQTPPPVRRPVAEVAADDFAGGQAETPKYAEYRGRPRKRRKKAAGGVAWLVVGGMAATAVLALVVGVGIWLLAGRETISTNPGRPVAKNDDKQGRPDPNDGSPLPLELFKDKSAPKYPDLPRDGQVVTPDSPAKPVQTDKPIPAGGIVLSDWQVTTVDGVLWKERPFDKIKYSLNDGVLVINNNLGANTWAGITTKQDFTGDFTIKAEVMNVTKALGLRSPTDDGVTTAWAAIGPIPGNDWHTVLIVASRGQIAMTVDGTLVRYVPINLGRLTSAVFFLHVNPNDTAAIRRFEIVGGVRP